jgi:phage tail-like protein
VPGDRTDPFLRYNFVIEIEGLVAGGFQEVTGLQSEIETREYREGGVNEFMHKLAGPVRYPSNLILKRGITDTRTLWGWYCDVAQGTVKRRNISLLLMDTTGREKIRWNFAKAYPVKWSGPDMRGDATEVAVETVELAHNGISKG